MKHTIQALRLTSGPMQALPASAAANVSDVDVTIRVNSARAAEGAHTLHNELTVKP